MDGVPRAMCFILDLAMKLNIFQNHKAMLEPYDSIDIFSETLHFT
jgi:hypothetical protein